MTVPLSSQAVAFLDEKVWAHVATLMKDGSPQVTPVWVETDGANILINTAEGRIKTNNIRRDGRVALSIMGMENAYRCLWVRGRVTEVTTDGADEQIDGLSRKYTGEGRYQGHRPDVARLKVTIEPLRVRERGL